MKFLGLVNYLTSRSKWLWTSDQFIKSYISDQSWSRTMTRFPIKLVNFLLIQYFYRIYPISVAPERYFSKIPFHLNVTLFTHRDMQRNIEKYAVKSIVTLNFNGKYTVTPKKYIALRASLHFWWRVTGTVTFTIYFAVTFFYL